MSTDSLQFRLPDLFRSALASRWWPHGTLLRRALALLLFALAIALALWPARASAGPPRANTAASSAIGPPVAGPGMAAVPVRLAEPAIVGLLHPGMRVDLVAAGSSESALPDEEPVSEPSKPRVLATAATVLTVRPGPGRADTGRADPGAATAGRDNDGNQLVVLALPERDAADVAASTLRQRLTVTLR